MCTALIASCAFFVANARFVGIGIGAGIGNCIDAVTDTIASVGATSEEQLQELVHLMKNTVTITLISPPTPIPTPLLLTIAYLRVNFSILIPSSASPTSFRHRSRLGENQVKSTVFFANFPIEFKVLTDGCMCSRFHLADSKRSSEGKMLNGHFHYERAKRDCSPSNSK
ncbi:unnamed protein product [Nippostrongylus brasiliensis]|uniref:Secreted protein n=1 Tax=Nippostrongylus brasiliensis TaxID=27835 RepID=A0A0N4XV87_NIPBR|nr:unnamed protein product [Nippostrongylus brasiliensis]